MASQERLWGISLQYKLAFEGLKTTDMIASLYLLWDVYNCYKLWFRLSWEREAQQESPVGVPLGGGSTGCLSPVRGQWHLTPSPFQGFSQRKCAGPSKMSCAEIAAHFLSPAPWPLMRTMGIELQIYGQELDSWISVGPFQLKLFLILWLNSSSHAHNSECAQTYCACMIKLSEFWLWKFGWKPYSGETVTFSTFSWNNAQICLHTANIGFCFGGALIIRAHLGTNHCLPCFRCDFKHTREIWLFRLHWKALILERH